MKYTLHYASKTSTENIPVLEFKEYNALAFHVLKQFAQSEKVVYLFTFECNDDPNHEYDEIIITENSDFINQLLKSGQLSSIDLVLDVHTFFIQEYDSFEEAYKVALNMKETSSLCYEK